MPGADRRGHFWKGVVIGAVATVLLLALLMVGMMAFGGRPMRGRGMGTRMGDRGVGAHAAAPVGLTALARR